MKIIETIFIKRPLENVWDFLKNPENMPRWNPKVTYVSPSVFSDPEPGYRYKITYCLNERAQPKSFQAEFIHFEPPTRLVIRLAEQPSSAQGRVIEESYELVARNGGTFLTQTILVINSGINIFLRILVWAIRKWGKPTGKPYLAELRDIIEGEAEQNQQER